jgi:two-component system chemotaxis sensor kinase CheA
MDNGALKNEFLVESFENLSSINEDLTYLEKDPKNKELLNKIYRTVHTMKGSASFLGYKKLQELTHSSENLLDELREDNLSLDPQIVDSILKSFDLCNAILKSIESDDNEGNEDIAEIKNEMDFYLSDEYKESKNKIDETNDNDELVSLIASHKESPEPAEEENADNGFSSAAMDSLKELIGEGKMDASALDELSESASAEEKVSDDIASVEDSDFSSAAMDSLKELIGEGKMDASALDELNVSTPSTETISADTASVEDSDFSSAAMDSLKELVGEGKMDASALDELNTKEDTQVVKEEKQVIKKVEKPVELEDKVGNDISRGSIADSVVRVNVTVLDNIMNIVGELVLNRNQIVQYSNTQNSHEFSKLSQHLNTITSELQSEVMSTRMQPIGSILTKFERLVRDFSRTGGKKINLKLSGQDTELDKTLIEAIKDPLVHIIRNACDHGIGTIEEREAAGKTADGDIWIKAYNESGQVTIEIVDNGKGLNKEKIGKKAIEKGVITSDQFESMNDQQIYGLIFAPGFSTAEEITNISGRGVGMDVVKTNIEKIGGSVSVNSELGVGTTFKLRIPLTLAIVPALVIKSLGESFAIPQLNLVELVRLETQEEQNLIEHIHGSEFLKLRGHLTPVFRLNTSLELEFVNSKTVELQKIVENNEISDRRNSQVRKESQLSAYQTEAINIVIVQAEGTDFGIIVDEILDTEEIVVKPLSNSLKHLSLFGGATIMGDGKVALILDALGFLNTFTDNRDRIKEDIVQTDNKSGSDGDIGEKQENLLFKMGDGRVYAVPLQLVTRLEEFSVKDIEKTGNQPIIRYLNSPVPLINVEKTLKLNGKSMLETYTEKGKEVISCIITTIRNKNFGIIVDEILDININNNTIDATAVDREGILGTIFIDDKTVSLVDLYAIIEAQGLGIQNKASTKEVESNSTKKILLVDDSAMYRKMEGDVLIDQGYQVDIANHGEHGYELFQQKKYDLLVTDIEMPILDGFDFVQRIRSESSHKDIPVIALSTRVSDQDRERGKLCGFDYHLEKFKKDDVIDLVKKVLSGV